jgi:hypothetical protein
MLADPRREGASAPASPRPSSCPALKLGLVFSDLDPACLRQGAGR